MLPRHDRPRLRNPHPALVAVILAMVLGAGQPVGAAKPDPGPASPTMDARNKGSQKGIRSTNFPTEAGADTMSVNAPASAKETLYSTDENTDLLERAIERFNRERCPPNDPIRQIDSRALGLLAQYRYLPSDTSRFARMVIRDGKVYKPVEQKPTNKDPQVDIPRGEVPDSLLGVIGVVAEGLDEKSPKGTGTPPPSKQTLVEERRAVFRNQQGETVEFKYFVPKVPPLRTRPILGKALKAPLDMVKKTLLPPKYKTGTTSTEPVSSSPPQQ